MGHTTFQISLDITITLEMVQVDHCGCFGASWTKHSV